ncbi:MAG TPA: hypothetical protein DCX07_03045 [Phycisphaerales bacterium]|nr:hypothetical protein [Phycisphaerales bacterium]
MTRRGFTFYELLVTFSVFAGMLAIGWLALRTLFVETPRDARMVESHRHLGVALDAMRRDVESAAALPDAAGSLRAGQECLLITAPDGLVCYLTAPGVVVRRTLSSDGTPDGRSERVWEVPHGRLRFQRLEDGSRTHAAVVRSHFEIEADGTVLHRLAGAQVFFLPAARQEPTP